MRIWALVAAAAFGTTVGARAQSALEDFDYERVSRMAGGPARVMIALSSRYAIYADGAILRMADYADPTAPTTLSEYTLDGLALDVAIDSRTVFVSTKRRGIYAFTVAVEENPGLTFATRVLSEGTYARISASDDWLYLSDGSAVRELDVSNPNSPQWGGALDTNGGTRDLAAASDYVYLADEDIGLRVMRRDSSGAWSETHRRELPDTLVPVRLTFSSGELYLSTSKGGGAPYNRFGALLVFDLVDLAVPTASYRVDYPGDTFSRGDVAVSNGPFVFALYSNETSGGVLVLADTSDGAPAIVGAIETPEAAAIAMTANDVLLVGDDYRGVTAYDVSPEALESVAAGGKAPTLSISYCGGVVEDVAVSGARAYVAKPGVALAVYDLYGDAFARPVPITTAQDAGIEGLPSAAPMSIAANETDAFVMRFGGAGASVRTENDALRSALVFTSSGGYAVAAIEETFYFCDRERGLQVADVSSGSANPTFSLFDPLADRAGVDVAVDGSTAYVLTADDSVFALDAGLDPANPTLVGGAGGEELVGALSLDAHQGILAVARIDGAVAVFDVSNPQSVTVKGVINVGEPVHDVALLGNYLFVARGEHGFDVYLAGRLGVTPPVASIDDPGGAARKLKRVEGKNRLIVVHGLTGFSLYDFSFEPVGAEDRDETPGEFFLSQNYPNPFNPATTIRYALPEAATVRLTIYNALGQVVRELESSAKQAGYHEATFNASDLGSGVYFYRIDALGASGERFQETRKALLVK
ncbi:MAG: T9SS type A sorting domain-containing protein [Ignavibacteriales bacterium]|nr:T9SS type A sorting domain-containing protein [Ignavibacteriales bacterium]